VGVPRTVTRPWPGRRARPGRRSLLRGLSGVLAGGLVALALVLLAGWIYADRTGLPGPGLGMLVGHGVGAVTAVAAQVWADRRPDGRGALVAAAITVLVVVGLTLVWLF
jgi:hypothetical protein